MSDCVHYWRWILTGQHVTEPRLLDEQGMPWRGGWCRRCGTLKLGDQLYAPDAMAKAQQAEGEG